MAVKNSKKTSRLNMAVTPETRKLFDRAAKAEDLQTSVWAQRELLRIAREKLGVK